MAFFRNLSGGMRSLFQKESVEQELDEELREFVDASAAEKMRAGMNREQAFRQARMEMGGLEVVKENVREATWESWAESLWSDLRFGFRLLRFHPVFAVTAILSLALGIGANTAIFQLLDAVRLRTLPVDKPQEFARVAIDHRNGASGDFTSRYSDLTYAMWEQIRAEQEGFTSIFAWGPHNSIFLPVAKCTMCKGCGSVGSFSPPWASNPWSGG